MVSFRNLTRTVVNLIVRENALRILKLVDSLLGLQDHTELFPTNLDTFRTEDPS